MPRMTNEELTNAKRTQTLTQTAAAFRQPA
jgi:hypothetical protein